MSKKLSTVEYTELVNAMEQASELAQVRMICGCLSDDGLNLLLQAVLSGEEMRPLFTRCIGFSMKHAETTLKQIPNIVAENQRMRQQFKSAQAQRQAAEALERITRPEQPTVILKV